MASVSRLSLASTALLVLAVLLSVHGQGEEGGETVTERSTETSSSVSGSTTDTSATARARASVRTVETTTTAPADSDATDPHSALSTPSLFPEHGDDHGPPGSRRDVGQKLRKAILGAKVDRVANLLRKVNDTVALGLGFTFPSHLREENFITTKARVTDPDVVALKGMATAALAEDLAEKLADVFINAVYGLDFIDTGCPEMVYSYSMNISGRRTVTENSYRTVHNESGSFQTHGESDVIRAFWQHSVSTDELNFGIEEEAVPSQEAESDSDEEDCYSREEVRAIRRNLIEDFSDLELMTEIIEGIPPKADRRSRTFFLIATTVNSWLCAGCWKESFCNENVYWCPQ